MARVNHVTSASAMTHSHARLTEGSISGHLVSMTVPMVWAILGVMLFNVTDTWFVAQLGVGERDELRRHRPVGGRLGQHADQQLVERGRQRRAVHARRRHGLADVLAHQVDRLAPVERRLAGGGEGGLEDPDGAPPTDLRAEPDSGLERGQGGDGIQGGAPPQAYFAPQ